MKFPHLFYVPAHPDGFLEKGTIRLEFAQAVPAAAVTPDLKDLKAKVLSEKAWAILQHRLCAYACRHVLDPEIESVLIDYSALVMEAFGEATK